LPLSAQAQTSEFVQIVPTQYLASEVNYSLGAIALSMPTYTGASDRRVAVYPMFDLQTKSGIFFSAISGLGYNFSKDASVQYGLRLGMEGARDESRSPRLAGLGDINSAIEPGAFANINLSENFSLASSLRYGSGFDRNGIQFSLVHARILR